VPRPRRRTLTPRLPASRRRRPCRGLSPGWRLARRGMAAVCASGARARRRRSRRFVRRLVGRASSPRHYCIPRLPRERARQRTGASGAPAHGVERDLSSASESARSSVGVRQRGKPRPRSRGQGAYREGGGVEAGGWRELSSLHPPPPASTSTLYPRVSGPRARRSHRTAFVRRDRRRTRGQSIGP
jgi:hypothetical protein